MRELTEPRQPFGIAYYVLALLSGAGVGLILACIVSLLITACSE